MTNSQEYIKDFEKDLLSKPNRFNKKIFLIIISIVLISLFAVLAFIFANFNKEAGTNAIFLSFDSDIEGGLVPGMSEEQIKKLLQEQVDASMIGFQINGSPAFENGQSKGNLLIGNPPSNTYNLKVSLTLDSTGEILYESGLIPPNNHISEVALSRNLPKGHHKATATIYAYQNDPLKYLGETGVSIDINIKN